MAVCAAHAATLFAHSAHTSWYNWFGADVGVGILAGVGDVVVVVIDVVDMGLLV